MLACLQLSGRPEQRGRGGACVGPSVMEDSVVPGGTKLQQLLRGFRGHTHRALRCSSTELWKLSALELILLTPPQEAGETAALMRLAHRAQRESKACRKTLAATFFCRGSHTAA